MEMGQMVGEWMREMVVPGMSAVLFAAGVALVREWAKRLRDERTRKVLEVLVEAAEQLYGPGKGEAKRRFVRERLKQRGLNELVREDVEAAVFRLKTE